VFAKTAPRAPARALPQGDNSLDWTDMMFLDCGMQRDGVFMGRGSSPSGKVR
jgi:hypothetical protein